MIQWEVDDVVKWIQGLKLSQDYSSLIKEEHMNGMALETMQSSDDWKMLGVQKFGDQRALVNAVKKLFQQS